MEGVMFLEKKVPKCVGCRFLELWSTMPYHFCERLDTPNGIAKIMNMHVD